MGNAEKGWAFWPFFAQNARYRPNVLFTDLVPLCVLCESLCAFARNLFFHAKAQRKNAKAARKQENNLSEQPNH